MGIHLAVLSHRRAEIFERETLAYLMGTDWPPGEVDLFLSDKEDESAYWDVPCRKIITHCRTVREKFNFIHNHYPVGERVFVMEDDVRLVRGLARGRNDKLLLNSLVEFVQHGFAETPHGGLWGIAPHDNAFYFSHRITRTLKLIVAHAFGFVSTHDNELEVHCETKTDYERTCRYFIRYGEVVRLDWVGVKTRSYTQPGGMQATHSRGERAQMEQEACEWLVRKFPALLRHNPRKNSVFAELSFKKDPWGRR